MPTSRATSPAISWARSASFAPMAAHASARSCAGTWDQASKAGRAAVTARSTSLASPTGIVPITCSVVESTISNVPVPWGSTHSPPMYRRSRIIGSWSWVGCGGAWVSTAMLVSSSRRS